MPTPPRPALEAELFGTLFLLSQHVARRTDVVMEPLGLTTKQWLLLAVLTRLPPGTAPTLSEAARAYGTSRQNVKQIALQLEARGYLCLVSDPADRRAWRLRLTDQVRLLDTPTEQARQLALLAEIFAGLADAELVTLRTLMGRWWSHFAPLGGSS